MRVAELYAAGPLPAIVHCGAQTTADTEALAAHAASVGSGGCGGDRAAVLRPRRAGPARAFPARRTRVRAAAVLRLRVRACERLRRAAARRGAAADELPNLAGLKVSDSPFDRVRPYLVEGLDVFVGAESLVDQGMAAGAAGAVSRSPRRSRSCSSPPFASRHRSGRPARRAARRGRAVPTPCRAQGRARPARTRRPRGRPRAVAPAEPAERTALFEAVEPWLGSS